MEIGAGQMDKYEDYFDPTGQLFVLYSAAGAKESYYPCTYRNQEMVKGLLTYTYPDAPDVTPVQDTQQYGWYGLYFSAAETNSSWLNSPVGSHLEWTKKCPRVFYRWYHCFSKRI